MGRVQGKVAFITGAGRGQGRSHAVRLAEEGADIIAVDICHDVDSLPYHLSSPDDLKETARQIEALDRRVVAVQADVRERAQLVAAIDRGIAELGKLDIVVANAGVIGQKSEQPLQAWADVFDTNGLGIINAIHAALPHLVAAAGSSPRRVADVVNISSTAGRVARPGSSVYNLTKFGVNAFSEALRQELVGHRVRVGVVEPGTVDTELVDHVTGDIQAAARQQVAAIEALRPEDIADAVAYIVTRDRRVAVNEMLVRAGDQTW